MNSFYFRLRLLTPKIHAYIFYFFCQFSKMFHYLNCYLYSNIFPFIKFFCRVKFYSGLNQDLFKELPRGLNT